MHFFHQSAEDFLLRMSLFYCVHKSVLCRLYKAGYSSLGRVKECTHKGINQAWVVCLFVCTCVCRELEGWRNRSWKVLSVDISTKYKTKEYKFCLHTAQQENNRNSNIKTEWWWCCLVNRGMVDLNPLWRDLLYLPKLLTV